MTFCNFGTQAKATNLLHVYAGKNLWTSFEIIDM